MTTTTIKVPTDLRDRLAEVARREHTTLAGAIARSLDAAENAAFWEAVEETMGGSEPQREAEQLSGSLADGLDPDETWDDVL